MKLGYRDHDDALNIGTLITDSDDQFFHKIINNRLHILQQFIPDRTSVNYKLRTRKHSKTLTPKTTDFNERNIWIRNLYKYSY